MSLASGSFWPTSWHSAWWVEVNHSRARGRPLLVHSRLGRPGVIAEAAQPTHTFELMPKERVVSLRPACCSSPESAAAEAPRTRSGTWDHRPPAAAGGRPGSMCWLPEACSSTPQPLRHRQPGVPCRRRPSTLLQASPTEKDLAGTLFDSWRTSLTG